MKLNLLGACHPDCPWCAKEFWRWYAARMKNANKADGRSGSGSFAAAAATSIKAT